MKLLAGQFQNGGTSLGGQPKAGAFQPCQERLQMRDAPFSLCAQENTKRADEPEASIAEPLNAQARHQESGLNQASSAREQ
jgi:hypothetical protein